MEGVSTDVRTDTGFGQPVRTSHTLLKTSDYLVCIYKVLIRKTKEI